MGLIQAHGSYLTQLKNEETFEHRIDLLRKLRRDQSTFEESGSELDLHNQSLTPLHFKDEYDRLVRDLCSYQNHVREHLIKTLQQVLDIEDEKIITLASEAY
jgi:hypothetical protein